MTTHRNRETPPFPDPLQQEDIQTILDGFLRRRGGGATQAELEAVVQRVRRMRVEGLMATWLCEGKVEVVGWRDGDLLMVPAHVPTEEAEA
jgi:hypothetical protein